MLKLFILILTQRPFLKPLPLILFLLWGAVEPILAEMLAQLKQMVLINQTRSDCCLVENKLTHGAHHGLRYEPANRSEMKPQRSR